MKTITYRYFRQEFNYLQERVDALCAGLGFHVQVCEINHPMDPIRLGVNWSAIGAVPADQAAACGAAITKAADCPFKDGLTLEVLDADGSLLGVETTFHTEWDGGGLALADFASPIK